MTNIRFKDLYIARLSLIKSVDKNTNEQIIDESKNKYIIAIKKDTYLAFTDIFNEAIYYKLGDLSLKAGDYAVSGLEKINELDKIIFKNNIASLIIKANAAHINIEEDEEYEKVMKMN